MGAICIEANFNFSNFLKGLTNYQEDESDE